jgi:hypothetical protein
MTVQELIDEKDSYHYHYCRFSRMSTPNLQKVLGDLAKRRYEDYEVDCYTEHRIAARVYLERTRKGEGLIFHLQNFLG